MLMTFQTAAAAEKGADTHAGRHTEHGLTSWPVCSVTLETAGSKETR